MADDVASARFLQRLNFVRCSDRLAVHLSFQACWAIISPCEVHLAVFGTVLERLEVATTLHVEPSLSHLHFLVVLLVDDTHKSLIPYHAPVNE